MFNCSTVNEDAFTYYPRLQKVKRYVDQHYSETISLEIAAQVAGLERTYFSNFFHAKTGVGFKDWLTYVRVSHAIELIKSENRPMSHIAIATGFHSVSAFERAFKKCVGLAPQTFKKSVRPS